MKEWDEVYFTFKEDFERCNPVTKKKGNMNYLEKLLEKKILTDDEFNTFREKINNKEDVNVVEIYNRKVSGKATYYMRIVTSFKRPFDKVVINSIYL